MPRRPDTPCAGCGKLGWSGSNSLPPGQYRCLGCRRIRVKTCAGCGAEFSAYGKGDHVYCSKACCNRALGAARRRTPRSRPCKLCGTEFVVDPKNGKQAYCSTGCVGEASRRGWPSSPIYFLMCPECKQLRVLRRKRKLCSAACQKARQARRYHDNPKYRNAIIAHSHKRRAHKLGLGNHYITLAYLIKRDKGRCHATVCHFRSSKVGRLGIRSPRQPSMDHIIPLSRGGKHELANVHLTHYRCNLSKNNRGGGEQLMLVG